MKEQGLGSRAGAGVEQEQNKSKAKEQGRIKTMGAGQVLLGRSRAGARYELEQKQGRSIHFFPPVSAP